MKESELVLQIQDGNKQAFRDLYDLYFDYSVRVATIVMNHNQAHAADAVQETFIRVYQNIHLYQLDRPFQPWFYKILLNECNRILRRNAKLVSVSHIENEKAELETHDFVEYEDLYLAIEKLEPHNRTPIILKYLNGMKEQEIAEILDENVNTIKSRLFKGRQKLKNFLQTNKGGITNGR